VDKFVFYEGEKREITAVITSRTSKELVVIASAEYKLIKTYDNTVVQEGSCDISGNEVRIYLEFDQKGKYELQVTSSVGREKIIDKIDVIVE
jgi:hypothetical protein